jgi:hypothetical protein
VVAITILATANRPPKPNTAPSIAGLAIKIAIGVGLVAIAVRQRRKMSQPKKPKKPPKWQAGVDRMSPWFAMGLAPLLQPWGLIAAGVATVMEAKLSSFDSYIALFAFCVVATSSYISLELYAGFRPETSQAFLSGIKAWIENHTDQAIIIGSLVLGFWLIGKSIYLLVT